MSNVKVVESENKVKFFDVRTVIAACVARFIVLETRTIVQVTTEITEDVAAWLLEEAGEMRESDDRKPGYEDLARRFIAR